MSAIDDFKLLPSDVRYVGHDLSRPECIIAERDGTLWIADNRGAITVIDPNTGLQRLFGAAGGVPNGIAMTLQGDFIVADIGAGEVYRIDAEGNKEVMFDSIDGQRIGAANFVYLDNKDRLWVAVSTVTQPRSDALKAVIPDGYIVVVDESGPRRVAENLRFTNEVRIDAKGEYLYVAETTAGGVTRFRVSEDGSLTGRETFGPMPFFEGALVDGISFDSEGNLWVTEITRNQLVVIKPDGQAVTVFEDPTGAVIHCPTSVTFGGEDLRTVYIGSLHMNQIASFDSPIAGTPMRHWNRQERT